MFELPQFLFKTFDTPCIELLHSVVNMWTPTPKDEDKS